MFSNKSVDVHRFSMVPRADIPRSKFKIEKAHKATFDAGLLVPVMCEEVLPGDQWSCKMTAFARLATPLFPIMDNLHLDSFFFFVPCRLVWSNWKRFMGEQASPGASISFVVPTVTSGAGGFLVGSLFDHFALPTVGQVAPGSTVTVNVLPLRAYNLIFNEWFRDENLVNGVSFFTNDGPDSVATYNVMRRGKRADYFTTALPSPQKGSVSVALPLGTVAPVKGIGKTDQTYGAAGGTYYETGTGSRVFAHASGLHDLSWYAEGTAATGGLPAIYADLSEATAATINQLRQAFQIQKLLERDARGGTRYTEIVRSHFGVVSPDARLQRPEYLGGSSSAINVSPIAQASGTGASGTSTPLGTLGAMATGVHQSSFSQSFTEHGYIIGIVNVRADLTYQQGLRKMWSRSTRYDFYFPAFAALGEQAVLSKEIYCDGTAGDNDVFGYQERWAEYRYSPSTIVGLFRSTAAGTIDAWHLSQRFTSRPVLNAAFINDTPPVSRVVAVGAGAAGQQLLFDSVFEMYATRPMPAYSVPGLIDHF